MFVRHFIPGESQSGRRIFFRPIAEQIFVEQRAGGSVGHLCDAGQGPGHLLRADAGEKAQRRVDRGHILRSAAEGFSRLGDQAGDIRYCGSRSRGGRRCEGGESSALRDSNQKAGVFGLQRGDPPLLPDHGHGRHHHHGGEACRGPLPAAGSVKQSQPAGGAGRGHGEGFAGHRGGKRGGCGRCAKSHEEGRQGRRRAITGTAPGQQTTQFIKGTVHPFLGGVVAYSEGGTHRAEIAAFKKAQYQGITVRGGQRIQSRIEQGGRGGPRRILRRFSDRIHDSSLLFQHAVAFFAGDEFSGDKTRVPVQPAARHSDANQGRCLPRKIRENCLRHIRRQRPVAVHPPQRRRINLRHMASHQRRKGPFGSPLRVVTQQRQVIRGGVGSVHRFSFTIQNCVPAGIRH